MLDGDRGLVVVGWLEDCIEHISLFVSLSLLLLLSSPPSLPSRFSGLNTSLRVNNISSHDYGPLILYATSSKDGGLKFGFVWSLALVLAMNELFSLNCLPSS